MNAPRNPARLRSRSERPPLTRELIVGEAVTLLREEGLEKLTMRRVAAQVQTGPASLYVYFRSTGHLHAAVLDELLGEVDLTAVGADGAWRTRLSTVMVSYTNLLFGFPGVARLCVFTRPSGPNYLRLLEGLLSLLAEGGVVGTPATWAADLLLQYATATAAEHGTRSQQAGAAEDDSELAAAIAGAPAKSFPLLHAYGGQFFAGDNEQRFQWGLDLLIDGALSRAGHPHGAA